MSLVHKNGTHKAAFRCKNCGHLVHSGHAGERDFPLACPVCKAGAIPCTSIAQLQKDRPALFEGLTEADLKNVKDGGRVGTLPFSMVWFADHSNWEHLADCTAEKLKEYGLEPHHVEAHVPAPKGEQGGTHHARFAADGGEVADAGSAVKG